MIKKRNTIKQYEYMGQEFSGLSELQKLGADGWKLAYWSQGVGVLTRAKPNKKLKL